RRPAPSRQPARQRDPGRHRRVRAETTAEIWLNEILHRGPTPFPEAIGARQSASEAQTGRQSAQKYDKRASRAVILPPCALPKAASKHSPEMLQQGLLMRSGAAVSIVGHIAVLTLG